MRRAVPALLAVALLALPFAGCRSTMVDVTIENHSGQNVHLLEVEYPSASFGANDLADGGHLRAHVQLRGTGLMKLQYEAPGSKTVHIDGPDLSEGQSGQLTVILLPAGTASFTPRLSSHP